VVKPDKGFGFVELANGSGDAFLHVSVVERGGHGSVPPGATLEVRAGPGPKGLQVTEILSIDTSTALQEQSRRARPERPAYSPRPAYPSAGRPTVEELDTVKWYNSTKGFGFIVRDGGGKGYLRARIGTGAVRGDGPGERAARRRRRGRRSERTRGGGPAYDLSTISSAGAADAVSACNPSRETLPWVVLAPRARLDAPEVDCGGAVRPAAVRTDVDLSRC